MNISARLLHHSDFGSLRIINFVADPQNSMAHQASECKESCIAISGRPLDVCLYHFRHFGEVRLTPFDTHHDSSLRV